MHAGTPTISAKSESPKNAAQKSATRQELLSPMRKMTPLTDFGDLFDISCLAGAGSDAEIVVTTIRLLW